MILWSNFSQTSPFKIPFRRGFVKQKILNKRLNFFVYLNPIQARQFLEEKELSLQESHFIWVKVFKNGPSKICGRQPLKNLKWYGLLYHFKFFKGWLPQILLGPFLNSLSHILDTRNLVRVWLDQEICT